MFMYLQKSKKGFTLIELMVVVAIIGVLALLGLRLYVGQQQKAKNAVVKANAGTVQTLIQANLADQTAAAVWTDVGTATTGLIARAGIYVPDGAQQTANGATGGTEGEVYVEVDDTDDPTIFYINGNAFGGSDVYTTDLTAQK